MKKVLISTKPKWCEDIASGKKKIEVRKSRPKIETPFKCLIYCTKDKYKHLYDLRPSTNGTLSLTVTEHNSTSLVAGNYWNGKVIGEFVCDRIDEYTAEFVNDEECYEDIRRKWIDEDGEEDFEIITSNDKDNPEDCELLKNSCLAYAELKKYIGENFHDIPFYGWHISDLKIYDKPKELSEFKQEFVRGAMPVKLIRPPQSWCYVE
ncbi:MAG: hypothetical protein IJF76_04325 [Clostridia bacterium]|nr:hypothetical protein [Clostridia bacterium]